MTPESGALRNLQSGSLQVNVLRDSLRVTIQLEGRLVFPWVRLVRTVWDGIRDDWQHPYRVIDLRQVQQVDADGADLLREMVRSGCRPIVTNGSLRSLLHSISQQVREMRLETNSVSISR
jgi:hypothetical protein